MPALSEFSNALAAAVEYGGAGTVCVPARPRLPASGIVWSADGVIVTAHHVVEQVGLKGKADLLASVLPHGDKRKLELGILLASDPQVLLLDEPTAGMASEQVPQLMALIAEIRQQGDKTILLVEHNMDVVMNVSDAITVMHYGQVLAEGTPTQIGANEQVQKAYLGELYHS